MADSTRAMAKDKRLPFAARAIVGRTMQPLALERKVAATASPQELRQIVYDHLLQERAQAMGMDPADVAITFQPDDINLLYNFKDLWRAQRPSDYNVVSFLKDGDRVFYQVQDPIMFQYFAGNKNPGALVKGIEWMLAPEMQAWKRNITQSLPFAVANLAGDTFNQIIHGTGAISWVPGGATMLGIWHKMSRKYPQVFDHGLLLSRDEPTGSELVNHIRHSAPWLFMAEGLKLSKNPDRKARYVENLMQPANLLYPFHKLVDMINLVTGGRHLARFFESATREGSAVYAKMTGQSDAAAKWAYWNVTGPFNDHPGLGDARVMARMPGFFNPMMQANRNYWRKAFDPDPAKSGQFWFKTFAMIPAIFGAGAVVRYLMMDETERDRERERPIEDRMAYYDLNGLRVRFPYGPEGSVGSFTYNAVMDHLLDRQPAQEDNKRARLLLNRIFTWEGADNFFGPQVKTVAEASRNWSSFRQRHIVAPWMASLPPSEQHYTHTPEFYKRLGRFLDYPPAKIEYMVSQGLSRQLDETIKLIERIDQGRPIEAASDLPYVGRMFIRDPVGFATASAREVGHIEERLTLLNRRLAAKGYASIDDERMHNPAALPPDLRALQVQVQQARLLRSSIGQMQRMSQLAGAAREAGDTTLEHNLQRSITLYAQAILTNNPDAAAHIEHTLQLLEAAADPGVEARIMDRLR
jgi:hypothetical protein